jgi:LCP family protein required for cell wall assembly
MARRRHRRITLGHVISRIITWGTLIALVAIAALAGLWFKFDNNITTLDTTPVLGTDRPTAVAAPLPTQSDPMNILLIGSDSREGSTIAGNTPGLSDTTIVVHIGADSRDITAISIPRDSMVDRPDCYNPATKSTVAGEYSMFNAAYSLAGPGCTQRTVEQLTGIRIDHFVIIDLAGFEEIVDALDGVPICVPEEVNDTVGNIYLPAGTYTADGKQALGYVRERHVSSVNGDLGRMKRQQVFLASMARKALSTGMLTSPTRLYGFLNATTKSLTTDPELGNISSLAGLASTVAQVDAKNIRLLSIPTEPYPADPNRLIWSQDAAGVWEALRNDTALPPIVRDSVSTARKDGTDATTEDTLTRPRDENGLCT